MPPPVTNSSFQPDLSALFRQRWGDRLVNTGEVRDIGGFNIDVTGTAARGQETYRSQITPGTGGKTYDPDQVGAFTPDGRLPASNLVTFPNNLRDVLESAQASADAGAQGVVGDNPYAVTLPAWVDIDHSEEGRPEQISTVRYLAKTGDAAQDMNIAQIDRLRALADVETQLRGEFGQAVKLAWDGGSDEYLMLRPGQDGYDRVTGANDLVDRLPRSLEMLGYTQGMIRDILA